PYGYSMPIAVRYTQDAFSRSGWLWPVDAKGEPLKATSYMAVGFYVAKDQKSGSAGMPRPSSYAVFCLKKKKTSLAAATATVLALAAGTNRSASPGDRMMVHATILALHTLFRDSRRRKCLSIREWSVVIW